MKLFDSLPVRLKVMSIIMVASVVGLLLTVGVVFVYDQHMIKKNMVREINILGEIIADRSTAALSFNDKKLARENLAALHAQPAVMLACIYDRDNKAFARFQGARHSPQDCPDTFTTHAPSYFHNHLHVFTPVMLNQARIGTVYIMLSTEVIQTRLRQYIFVVLLVITVVSMVVFLLSRGLQKPLLFPLLQLTEAAKSIAKNKDYTIRVSKQSSDEIGVLVDAFNDMLHQISVREKERDVAELELLQHREHLEELVTERTSELESFCYSVSHDLRTPLRAINGYSQIVMEDYNQILDEQGRNNLMRVRHASVHMGELIDDLLDLSRTSRHKMVFESVNISDIANEIISRLQLEHVERSIEAQVQEGLVTQADPHLIKIALENLIGNAWKYTEKTPQPKLEFGMTNNGGETVYYVRDNGAGFDMAYVERLFGPFQRLHTRDEFEGSGIGLAIVDRIIKRHGGRIWAQAKVNQGATFYFTLGTGKTLTMAGRHTVAK
jgi:signal transduction histidine kinase